MISWTKLCNSFGMRIDAKQLQLQVRTVVEDTHPRPAGVLRLASYSSVAVLGDVGRPHPAEVGAHLGAVVVLAGAHAHRAPQRDAVDPFRRPEQALEVAVVHKVPGVDTSAAQRQRALLRGPHAGANHPPTHP